MKFFSIGLILGLSSVICTNKSIVKLKNDNTENDENFNPGYIPNTTELKKVSTPLFLKDFDTN